MALRLLTSSENIRRNKGNSNAKLPTTPHRRSKDMVEQVRARNNWKLGGTHKQFMSNFKSIYKRPASIEEVKACVQQCNKTLRSYIQR
jgi:hypothetical protein